MNKLSLFSLRHGETRHVKRPGGAPGCQPDKSVTAGAMCWCFYKNTDKEKASSHLSATMQQRSSTNNNSAELILSEDLYEESGSTEVQVILIYSKGHLIP